MLVFECRYADARAIQRKIVYHAGPTNSGKTHHALERFMNAKSGVYCGPLRLLAFQVFQKLNDLVCVSMLRLSIRFVNFEYIQGGPRTTSHFIFVYIFANY